MLTTHYKLSIHFSALIALFSNFPFFLYLSYSPWLSVPHLHLSSVLSFLPLPARNFTKHNSITNLLIPKT